MWIFKVNLLCQKPENWKWYPFKNIVPITFYYDFNFWTTYPLKYAKKLFSQTAQEYFCINWKNDGPEISLNVLIPCGVRASMLQITLNNLVNMQFKDH